MAGETTSVAASAAKLYPSNPGAGLFSETFNLTYSTTQNETADVMEAGYLAPNVRVLYVIWAPTDMDSGTAAVHKVTVGSTDIVTGLTGAQTGVASLTVCTQASLAATPSTSPALVKVTTTTAASTAVAGTAQLILVCTPL